MGRNGKGERLWEKRGRRDGGRGLAYKMIEVNGGLLSSRCC